MDLKFELRNSQLGQLSLPGQSVRLNIGSSVGVTNMQTWAFDSSNFHLCFPFLFIISIISILGLPPSD